ncbi:MAG TPA: LysE family transporter [Actinomycetota bacterium]|nr:LysE family transporter [Actinomycetota bacterium]
MPESLSPAAAGFGLGIALASAPGPVQAVLMGEAIRGGVARGFRAMAGAAVTFASLLVLLALGLSVATPSGAMLRGLKIAGGLLLLWLAVDGFRTAGRVGTDAEPSRRRELPPAVRGVLAILLNPGAWLFLAAVASPLFAEATASAGRAGALLAAAALVVGLAMGDGTVVLIGGLGVRRAGEGAERWVARGLAVVLAGLGGWLLIGGVGS